MDTSNKFGLLLLLSILSLAIFSTIQSGNEKVKIKENPYYLIGTVTKVSKHINGSVLNYQFIYNHQKYDATEFFPNNKNLIDDTPFDILVVINKNEPEESRIILDENSLIEFEVPDSILLKYKITYPD